jgi:hypothetical protein
MKKSENMLVGLAQQNGFWPGIFPSLKTHASDWLDR